MCRAQFYGRDGALRRPRRVQRRNLGLTAAGFPFVPPAERGQGHRSAMSLPVRRLTD